MTPTHQLKTGSQIDVEAWRFLLGDPMPNWVMMNFNRRNFDRVNESPSLRHQAGQLVSLGDWIVRENDLHCCILTDAEFREHFRPLLSLATPAPSGLTPNESGLIK